MSKIIFFAIQTKAREIDEKLLLAYYALEKGYDIIIGRNRYIKDLVQKNRTGIVYNRPQYLNEENKKTQMSIAHDDEGLVYNIQSKSLRRNINPEPNIIITWGQNQKELYLEKYPELELKLHSLGSPRFDLIQ